MEDISTGICIRGIHTPLFVYLSIVDIAAETERMLTGSSVLT